MGGAGKMNVFLDTNVVIDFYGKRDGFFEDASLIFQMQKEGRLNATISSLTVVSDSKKITCNNER